METAAGKVGVSDGLFFYSHKNNVKMETGLTFTSVMTVDAARTALAMGSGDMEVLATPAMVALMENAAMRAVEKELPEGSTTVGALMNTTHVKPSPVGAEVSAEATLVEVDGRKLVFAVKASDKSGIIGEGTHVRYVVDREKFLAKMKG